MRNEIHRLLNVMLSSLCCFYGVSYIDVRNLDYWRVMREAAVWAAGASPRMAWTWV